ncbi:hypothetical protein BH09ACT12_BH09ACT12_07980 [soil metagenome]
MSEYQQERKGFWYEPEGTGTSEAIALETWARVAHTILEETAATYHGTITEGALAHRLLTETGIATARPHPRWLPKLLQPLSALHHRDGYPPLTALVVDGRGWVGERYDDVLRAADQLPVTDPTARERHAARARLECYQWAGSAPQDGGHPEIVEMKASRAPRAPRAATSSSSSASARTPRAPREPKPVVPKKVAATDRPVNVCPTCFMAIPATGVCDNCG